ARTTATPASQRNIGAAKPPRIVASRNATVCFDAARVHASVVCASIISSTATPRATSMYARRCAPLPPDVIRGRELDVLPHRVPHRAVLVVGQLNRARDRFVGHVAVDGDVQRDAREAV